MSFKTGLRRSAFGIPGPRPGSSSPRASSAPRSAKSVTSSTIIAQTFEQKRIVREAARFMQKYAPDIEHGMDREQLRWAWNMAEKSEDGTINREQLGIVLSQYNAYIEAHPHIEDLIREFDVNGDGVMDEVEMKKFLEYVSGRSVSSEDVDFVQYEIKKTAQARISSRYFKGMSTDPDILSRAVATWWFQKFNTRRGVIGNDSSERKIGKFKHIDDWTQFWADLMGCSLRGLCVLEKGGPGDRKFQKGY